MGQMQEGLYVGSLACTSAIPSAQSTLPSTLPRSCVLADIEGMGDSLDLVPIGGWRGQGRKKRWVSPWLMATYDARTGTLGSVCRVMSGFTDAFYKENTIKYLGSEILPEIGSCLGRLGGVCDRHGQPGSACAGVGHIGLHQ